MEDEITISSTDSADGSDAVVSAPRTQRQAARPSSRVALALALTGLSLVPVVGMLYLAVADFAPSPDDAAASASTPRGRPGAPPGEDDEDGELGAATDPRARSASGRREPRARTDGAALCCTKLRELGKSADLEQRASFLAAAAACDAAPSEERAFKQVRSVLGSSKVELPSECEGE